MTLIERTDRPERPRRLWPADGTPLPPAPHEHPDYVAAEVSRLRRAGVERAVAHLVAGRPGLAEFEMARTLQRQLRVAGVFGDEAPDPAPRVWPWGGRR